VIVLFESRIFFGAPVFIGNDFVQRNLFFLFDNFVPYIFQGLAFYGFSVEGKIGQGKPTIINDFVTFLFQTVKIDTACNMGQPKVNFDFSFKIKQLFTTIIEPVGGVIEALDIRLSSLDSLKIQLNGFVFKGLLNRIYSLCILDMQDSISHLYYCFVIIPLELCNFALLYQQIVPQVH